MTVERVEPPSPRTLSSSSTRKKLESRPSRVGYRCYGCELEQANPTAGYDQRLHERRCVAGSFIILLFPSPPYIHGRDLPPSLSPHFLWFGPLVDFSYREILAYWPFFYILSPPPKSHSFSNNAILRRKTFQCLSALWKTCYCLGQGWGTERSSDGDYA